MLSRLLDAQLYNSEDNFGKESFREDVHHSLGSKYLFGKSPLWVQNVFLSLNYLWRTTLYFNYPRWLLLSILWRFPVVYRLQTCNKIKHVISISSQYMENVKKHGLSFSYKFFVLICGTLFWEAVGAHQWDRNMDIRCCVFYEMQVISARHIYNNFLPFLFIIHFSLFCIGVYDCTSSYSKVIQCKLGLKLDF